MPSICRSVYKNEYLPPSTAKSHVEVSCARYYNTALPFIVKHSGLNTLFVIKLLSQALRQTLNESILVKRGFCDSQIMVIRTIFPMVQKHNSFIDKTIFNL